VVPPLVTVSLDLLDARSAALYRAGVTSATNQNLRHLTRTIRVVTALPGP
jgi:hypothetical protein